MTVDKLIFSDKHECVGSTQFVFSIADVSSVEDLSMSFMNILTDINYDTTRIVGMSFYDASNLLQCVVICSIEQLQAIQEFIDARDELMFTQIDKQLSETAELQQNEPQQTEHQLSSNVPYEKIPAKVKDLGKKIVECLNDAVSKGDIKPDSAMPVIFKFDDKKPS
mgnify:CR=1 FL=1